MKDEYSVLWKNGELQACWAASKAEALKIARAYKRAWCTADKPLKAFTEDEASAYRKDKCLQNIANMKESCSYWDDMKKYVPIYERGYRVLEKLLKHGHDIDKSNHLMLMILSNMTR